MAPDVQAQITEEQAGEIIHELEEIAHELEHIDEWMQMVGFCQYRDLFGAARSIDCSIHGLEEKVAK